MVKNLNHLERAAAALADEEADRLATYPIACGVSRRLIGDGSVTYREWCQDPEKYAEGFVAAQKAFDLDSPSASWTCPSWQGIWGPM